MIDRPSTPAPEPILVEPDDWRKQDLWAADQDRTDGSYRGVRINTLGELLWIFAKRKWSGEPELPGGMSRPNLTGADLRAVAFGGAELRGAILRGANLAQATLDNAHLTGAALDGAVLHVANLDGADLAGATLDGTDLYGAMLRGADLHGATLNGADLSWTALDGADLFGVELDRADLTGATLTGAVLDLAVLTGADLSHVMLDSATSVNGVRFEQPPLLLGVHWNGAPLEGIAWDHLKQLGDETGIERAKSTVELEKARRNAMRAYRGLIAALESRGLTEPAQRFRVRLRILTQ